MHSVSEWMLSIDNMWDTAKKQCVECPLGFYWINCSRRCVYPYFGYRCHENCFCEKDLCHFVRGCLGYIENSTKQLLSSCKTEIAKPDADKNSFVTVLTVIAVVCIACVMVFLFKELRQDHSDKHNNK
nr:uncharacterized protein LOC117686038 isoform X2 [Crassostrea gigas]